MSLPFSALVVVPLARMALQAGEQPGGAGGAGSPTGVLGELGWIDFVGLGLVGLLTILGLVRGLWWQVIRFVGVLAAIVVARSLSPRWVPGVHAVFPELDPRLSHGIVWLLVFLAALGIATLLGRLGRKFLEAMQLGLVDRMGGALTGALTGLLAHAVFLVGLSHLGPAGFVGQHLAGTYSDDFLDAVGRRWPVVLAKEQGEEIRSLIYGEQRAEDGGSGAGETPSRNAEAQKGAR